jgi:DNA-binding MarR family transcriptional regulator
MASAVTQNDRDFWRAFTQMRDRLELTLERRLQAEAGISGADYEVLRSLADEPSGRLRAGQIAETIGWEKSRLSHQVARMETRGLLERRECGDDARGVWVMLTEEGRDIADRALRYRDEAVLETFAGRLTDDEKAVFDRVSRRLLGALAEGGECAATSS